MNPKIAARRLKGIHPATSFAANKGLLPENSRSEVARFVIIPDVLERFFPNIA